MSDVRPTADDEHVMVISSDTHIGPRLKDQLRDYCPAAHLAQFDGYIAEHQAYCAGVYRAHPEMFIELDGVPVRGGHNRRTAGHHDIDARLRDMDYDGIAAEVIFHGSTNDEPIPFTNLGDPGDPFNFKNLPPHDPELATLGRHIYNHWLADFCSVEPERHAGLAQIPVWDIESSVGELAWAREAGLRGVNLPAPQSWLPEYNKPHWEPLWAAAADLDMPLVTHIGAGTDADYSGPSGRALAAWESTLFGTRALPWMVFSGVFERYPNLKYVITEVPGNWWTKLLDDLDSVHRLIINAPNGGDGVEFPKVCPQPPSHYCRQNIFVGASFMSRTEAQAATDEGYYPNYLWGSDYPHAEGTFHYPPSWDAPSLNHITLRSTFAGLPRAAQRRMLGLNAAEVFSLDVEALTAVAQRISALSFERLDEPVEPRPTGATTQEYRRQLAGTGVNTHAFRRGLWD